MLKQVRAKRISMMGLIALFFLSFQLWGCGYHLRGNIAIPEHLKNLYVKSETPFGRFEVQLKRNLAASGARLVDKPELANVLIEITHQKVDKQISTLGTDAKVQVYIIDYTISLQITDAKGVVLLKPTELTKEERLPFDKNKIQGNAEERALRLTEMRRDLVYQAMLLIRGALQKL